MPLFDKKICEFSARCKKAVVDAETYDFKAKYLGSLERLWERYAHYAHSGFQRQFLSDNDKFYSLTWEMLLANKLLEYGYNLLLNESDDAPDLCVLYNDQRVWIECSLPERGDLNEPDSVPLPNYSEDFSEYDIDKSVLRCTNILNAKKAQYLKWIRKGVCRPEDAFIIAINGKDLKLHIHDDELPDVIRALYGIGDKIAFFSPETSSIRECRYSRRENIFKESKKPVHTTFFLNTENQNIDGILFSNDWIGHWSSPPNYCFVENIKSGNKISPLWAKFCQTYEYTENSISLRAVSD
ncbi:MAG: hypothetical protein KAH96_00065 [Alphaproteobacteria bacterium]|nr:hypothetical protein [Alphaproteobacteria bacterium]